MSKPTDATPIAYGLKCAADMQRTVAAIVAKMRASTSDPATKEAITNLADDLLKAANAIETLSYAVEDGT